jgi:hypothetical protein
LQHLLQPESNSVAFPSFGDPRLGEIYRYWLSKHRDGQLPRRADIRPAELGAVVRNINLIDVIREPGKPLQFRHRLMGTATADWLGQDLTGRLMDETVYGQAAADIVASLAKIVERARPHHRLAPLDWSNRKFALAESVELPLAGETGQVAMILCGAVYRNRIGAPPQSLFEPLPLD